jgi:hypothetical protein
LRNLAILLHVLATVARLGVHRCASNCQMATALRASASAMSSRYGSQALALGARLGGGEGTELY